MACEELHSIESILYFFQKTSQAGEDDHEISGYMISVLFEETRSPREVEQEDRQRVMFLSAWIDSTPCKL